MEKNKPAKSIRRYVIVLTLVVVMLAVLVPYVQGKYFGDALYEDASGDYVNLIDTGVSGISNEDLDSLFKLIMNERYPEGSIYMTTSEDLNTPTKMSEHFGGTWSVWAVNEVPVGIDKNNKLDGTTQVSQSVFDFHEPTSGGSAGGSTSGSVAVPKTAFTQELELTAGKVTLSGETFSLSGGSVAINTTYSSTSPLKSNTISLAGPSTDKLKYLPDHGHTITWWGKFRQWRSGVGASIGNDRHEMITTSDTSIHNAANDWNNANSKGTNDYGRYDGSTVPASFTNNPKFGVAIGNYGQDPPDSFDFEYPTFSTSFITGTLSNLEWEYNVPTVATYPQQKITSHSIAAGGTGTTSNLADTTLQPYIRCYMFKRETLAPVYPWLDP
ncbi:MAG: hypothetical protein FWC27_12145 [Firmicutes bacterium]|nr:hypothetical protein [Bacillota bacterium]